MALGNGTVAGAVVMMYDTAAGQWIRPETTCPAELATPQRVSASGKTIYFVTWSAPRRSHCVSARGALTAWSAATSPTLP